jgi:pyrimidine dimer DNA glycosylase
VRLWSLHPKHLDARGLVAVWREGLLAQAVLRGRTRGYVAHPQLSRFREQPSPLGAIAGYLRAVHDEGARRGYQFALRRIGSSRARRRLVVTRGQLAFEWRHLSSKVKRRDPRWSARLAGVTTPRPHPLFRVVPGSVASWERAARVRASRARQPRQRAPVDHS